MTIKKIKTSNILGNNYYIYKLTSTNYTPNLDSTITITCICQDVYGDNIPNKTLTLYQNETSKGNKTTNSNGVATWSITCSTAGLQRFSIEDQVIEVFVDNKSEIGHTHASDTNKENTSNKVTSLSSSSTDVQYPSAKCVYDAINDNSISEQIGNDKIPFVAVTQHNEDYLTNSDTINIPFSDENIPENQLLLIKFNNIDSIIEAKPNVGVSIHLTWTLNENGGSINYSLISSLKNNEEIVSYSQLKSYSTILVKWTLTNYSGAWTVVNTLEVTNSKEDKSNKVTSLSSSSTDIQYPSAKCVYDAIGNIGTGTSIDVVDNLTTNDSTKALSAKQGKVLKDSMPIAEDSINNIKMNGTKNAGSLNTYARADHIHPSDTNKADSSHLHNISDVSNLQTTLDSKSDITHTHDSRYYTETEIDLILSNYTTPNDVQDMIDSAVGNVINYIDS